MAWYHNDENPYIPVPETTGRPFPPVPPEPKPGDWNYRRRSGGMEVVGLIAASSLLWGISVLLFWGMVAAFAASSEPSYNYNTGQSGDNAWLIIPGIIALALGVLCWVAAAYVGVKAVYRILEFRAEVSAIELVRRWRAAHAANAVVATAGDGAANAAVGSDASLQNTPGDLDDDR